MILNSNRFTVYSSKNYIRINKFEGGKTKGHVACMLEEKYKVLEGNILWKNIVQMG
jgi:hypothetical protein